MIWNGGLTWAPHPDPVVARRMLEIFQSWEGTRYMSGQCQKQIGVDCIRYGLGCLRELFRQDFKPFPRLPGDMAMHNRKDAIKVMHSMRRLFPDHKTVRDGICRPGSVIITGLFKGGPGHWRWVGPEPNTIWEVNTRGVVKSGWGFDPLLQHVFRVYEFNTESWK